MGGYSLRSYIKKIFKSKTLGGDLNTVIEQRQGWEHDAFLVSPSLSLRKMLTDLEKLNNELFWNRY